MASCDQCSDIKFDNTKDYYTLCKDCYLKFVKCIMCDSPATYHCKECSINICEDHKISDHHDGTTECSQCKDVFCKTEFVYKDNICCQCYSSSSEYKNMIDNNVKAHMKNLTSVSKIKSDDDAYFKALCENSKYDEVINTIASENNQDITTMTNQQKYYMLRNSEDLYYRVKNI